jgi:peroxiredoxin
MRKLTLPASVAAVALAAMVVCIGGCSHVKLVADRKAAPEFTLKDVNGATVKMSDYKGKVVLLDFWATWCGPCKIEIPWFIEFERTYKDRDFAVVGVSLDEDGWESVKPYIAEKKINYRVVIGDDDLSSKFGAIAINGPVEALPTTMVIDREGRIAAAHVGLTAKGDFEKEIEKLLEAPKNAKPVSVGLNGGFVPVRASAN